jgi:hypothetical protein
VLFVDYRLSSWTAFVTEDFFTKAFQGISSLTVVFWLVFFLLGSENGISWTK